MNKIAVSDTRAMSHLAKIGALDLLLKLYLEKLVPQAVFSELSQVEENLASLARWKF